MRILITGATGFIGRALAAKLAADPQLDVAILVRDNHRNRSLPDPLNSLIDRLVVVYADLREYHETRRALQAVRPDRIFHLAAGGVSDPFLAVDLALEQNLFTTLNLLRAAFEENPNSLPEKVVAVRTPGELSAMNPYAAGKAAAWQFCVMYARTRGWPIVGAMPFQTYGPGQDTRNLVRGAMAAAIAGEDFPLTAGSQEKDWIYVGDVVYGLIAVSNADLPPGTSLDLATGRLTSVVEVVKQIYDIAGGAGKPLIGAIPSRAGEVQVQTANIQRTQELIGWEAVTPLEQGLQRTYEQMRRRGRPSQSNNPQLDVFE